VRTARLGAASSDGGAHGAQEFVNYSRRISAIILAKAQAADCVDASCGMYRSK